MAQTNFLITVTGKSLLESAQYLCCIIARPSNIVIKHLFYVYVFFLLQMQLTFSHLFLALFVLCLHVGSVQNFSHHHKQLYAHRGMDVDNKALFTLGMPNNNIAVYEV